MVICTERGADLHTAQLMPLPLTVSCFSEIQIGFTSLVPAHPGSPGKGPLNVCVCVCVCVCVLLLYQVASHSKMRPIVTDVFRGLYLSVCLLVSTMSCAKTAELIEMSFATWTRVGPKNHVPDGGRIPHGKGYIAAQC